jgi:PAS domain-containing protein
MDREYLDPDLSAGPFFDSPIDQDREDDSSGKKDALTRHISSAISYFTNSKGAFGRQAMLVEQMIFYVNPSGSLIWASPKAVSTLKYTNSEIVEKKLADLIHTDDRLNFLDYLGKNISAQFINNTAVFRLLTKENDVIMMELRSKLAERGGESVIVTYAREYTLNVASALDGVLDVRVENLRLRIELAKALIQKGLDPKQNPYLQVAAKDPGFNLEARNNNAADEKQVSRYCRQCGTTESPEWRKGPEGKKT